MIIHYGIENLEFVNPVVTLGIFDGVHNGHRALLEYVVKCAKEESGESVVVTFDPHPKLVLSEIHKGFSFLSTADEKVRLLGQNSIDHLIIVKFDKILSNLGASDFVRDILVKKIGTKHLIVGHDHHFGRSREGDFNVIRKCGDLYDFKVEQIKEITMPGGVLSSTRIREALLEGKLEEANRLLGYSYSLSGTVIRGRKIGRLMGFPTANIRPSDIYKLIPANGVYAVEVKVGSQLLKGMLSIGFNPTVNTDLTTRSIEVHIFDFDGDLYGQEITVIFRFRLREEIEFESTKLLSDQLNIDMQQALKLLSL